ncbi:major facilitator superfamily protein-related [Holotrichia oblita]|uniref:Major facilitator superfamily protein-related n=1 Tax=Holotrichia oblita TaxID=644536 RepID=A0ACB9SGM8_HOLOL|nr:major facilitator superfamily protein-related [Holotrichia oblita]
MDAEKKNIEKFELDKSEYAEIKLYAIRWIVMGVASLYAASNAIQWLEYSIITNIIVKYYGVSSVTVDWTSMIAMGLYPVCMLPAMYLINKGGLRFCVLVGIIGTTIGAWIKIFSIRPDLFWVSFMGQVVVFAFQTFILSLPPKIAAVWFGPNEISTACFIGIFGTQLGTALSFVLPPLIVKNHDNLDEIGQELSYLFYGIAVFCTVTTILVFIFFKSEPPLPPSKVQAELRANKVPFSMEEFWKSYKVLMMNKNFWLLTISFGINLGVYISFCTMLNQIILEYFANAEKDAGLIGLLLVVTGMIGLIIFGIILDKTKKYKIFQTAYYGVGFEFGLELTYPQPESTSIGILIAIVQVFGIGFTLLFGQLIAYFGTFWALIPMVGFLIFGGIITLIIPNKLLRQEALQESPERTTFLPVIEKNGDALG